MKKLFIIVLLLFLSACSNTNVVTARETALGAQACAQLGLEVVSVATYTNLVEYWRFVNITCTGNTIIYFKYLTKPKNQTI